MIINSFSPQMSPHVDSSPTEGSDHVTQSPVGSPTTSERLLQQTAPFVYRESVAIVIARRPRRDINTTLGRLIDKSDFCYAF